jgi:hypothetical protein
MDWGLLLDHFSSISCAGTQNRCNSHFTIDIFETIGGCVAAGGENRMGMVFHPLFPIRFDFIFNYSNSLELLGFLTSCEATDEATIKSSVFIFRFPLVWLIKSSSGHLNSNLTLDQFSKLRFWKLISNTLLDLSFSLDE